MAAPSATATLRRSSAGTAALATVGAIAAGVLLMSGLRIALGATVNPLFLVPSGRRTGYPGWMRGPLAGHWSVLHLHPFLALMTVMVVAWLVLLLCVRALPGWAIWAVVGAATAIFALAPPLLSTDVFNYIAYGQMGIHGINPYLHGPVVLAQQPIYGYTGHLWKDVPSAYGPIFTLLTYALAPLSISTAFWVLKALTALALVAVAWFVWAAAKKLGRDPRFAVTLVALNPLVLVYGLGGAHNDLLMAVPLAASAYFVVSKRPASAGAAVVIAIAIKASAGLALPFVLLGARPRKRALLGAAVAAAVVLAVSLVAFGPAITKQAGALADQQKFHWIVVSVPAFLGYYAGLAPVTAVARHALLALAVAGVVIAIVRARGGRGWIEAAAAAGLIVLATTAWVLPWYVMLVLPFAALVRARTLQVAAIVLTALIMSMQLDHFVLTHASHHRVDHRIHAKHVTTRRATI